MIVKLFKYAGDEQQIDDFYVLLRNDLVDHNPVSTIKTLFRSVDDALIFGSDDRKELMFALTRLCSRSPTYLQIAMQQASDQDFEKFSFIYFYQSIWKDILEGRQTYPVTHLASSSMFHHDGSLTLDTKLKSGLHTLLTTSSQSFHALQPMFFINKASLGQLSSYDSIGQLVPAIVAQYAIRSGHQQTISDLGEAAIDIATLAIRIGAIIQGISGIRKAIVLADMVSAGITLSMNVTDADENLNPTAMNLLKILPRSARRISTWLYTTQKNCWKPPR